MARLLLDDKDGTVSEISVFETWDTQCLQPDLAGPPQATQTVGRKEAMAMLDSTPVT